MEKGVQLELSTKLREAFFKNNDFSMKNRSNTTETYDTFVRALKQATIKYKNPTYKSIQARLKNRA